jgi:penicillin-insensitive murein DD-endopeptidase
MAMIRLGARWVLAAVLVVALAGGAVAGEAKREVKARLSAASFAAVRAPSGGPAQSIGGYAAGCLAGGKALAPEGTGYQVIRLSRNRYYGHPQLIAFLTDFGQKVAAKRLGTALIGDLGQPRGGPLPSGHASHTIGLDADVWLRLDLPPMSRAERERLKEIVYVDYDRGRVEADAWSAAQAELIRAAAADSRVARVFVHPTIKKALCERRWSERAWLRKVRPWWGHDGHMHVRLSCPAGSPQCVDQAELPEGEGCDDGDLDNWIADASHPIVERRPDEVGPRTLALPAACRAVLAGGRVQKASTTAGR